MTECSLPMFMAHFCAEDRHELFYLHSCDVCRHYCYLHATREGSMIHRLVISLVYMFLPRSELNYWSNISEHAAGNRNSQSAVTTVSQLRHGPGPGRTPCEMHPTEANIEVIP